MSAITVSGIHRDTAGHQFLVTQGLSGYTLVDKKKILFRLYLDQSTIARTLSVLVVIKYRAFGLTVRRNIVIPSGDFLIENSQCDGPSIGIVFEGRVFPSAFFRHDVEFYLMTDQETLASFLIPNIIFQRSGRLRALVKSLRGTAPWGNQIEPNIGWFIEIGESLNRLASMLPVSDGVTIQTNPDPDVGLSWIGGQSFDTWPNPCPSGNPPSIPDPDYPNVLRCPANEVRAALVAEAKQLRSQGIRVDVTISWRPRDYAKFPPPGGEDMGGKGMIFQGERLAAVVGGSRNGVYYTAPIMAQEVGHTFGLEPIDSPHYDGGAHSKDPTLIDPYAFDFVRLTPYSPPPQGSSYLGDVMSYAWNQGMNSTLFNAYDWEHLRKQLTRISVSQRVGRKNMTEVIQRSFAKLVKIEVGRPGSSLPSKTGFQWNWTQNGFQLVKKGQKTRRSGLTSSAEGFLSALRDFGVSEFYAPLEGKPFSIVVNRRDPITCYYNEVKSSSLP